MTPDTVIWLLPVRNAMPYLTEALASIAAQTHREQFVLAWDNGSSDGSIKELASWIPGRIPGRMVVDRPMSLGACLAQMVYEAPGEFCVRMDGDDINEPTRVQQQLSYMQRHPEVAALGTGMTLIDQLGRALETITPLEQSDAEVRWALRRGCPLRHPTVMFRRRAVLEVGNYRDLKPGQDLDLWLRLGARHALANLPAALVRYRLHEASVTASHSESVSEVAERILRENLALLYPALDPAQAGRLHELLKDSLRLDVRWSDCTGLLKTAAAVAIGSGNQPWHLLRSRRYRAQLINLWIRWIKTRPGMRPLWPMFRRLRVGLRVG